MADEIKITIKGQVINGSFREDFTPGTISYDQGTKGSASDTVSVTSNTTTLSMGNIAGAEGFVFYRHINDTTFPIYLGSHVGSTAMDFARVQPNGVGCFEAKPGTTYTAYTTGSTATLQFTVVST